MKLTSRLNAVVNLVSYKSAADIGCDHGKVPIKLISDNICDFVIASDVNKGPVDACRRNVTKYGLNEKIDVRCGNGISVLYPEEVETLIIAGMGGELISKILDENLSIANSVKEIIMQPMTSEEHLREYLFNNGFSVINEVLAREGEKIYVIMKAVKGNRIDNLYFPKVLAGNNKELITMYYYKVSKRLKDKIKGSIISCNIAENDKYNKILKEVNEIYESISNS